MSSLYLELDSTYRDRNTYPEPADFVAPLSQSSTSPVSASDPVSDAAPLIVFTPFTTLTGTLYTGGSIGIVLSIPTAQAPSRVDNYYAGLVIRFSDGATFVYQRIHTWQYIQTVGANDFFEITLFGENSVPFSSPGPVTFQLVDPSSVADPSLLIFFVPESPFAENYYTGYYIFNQTLNQWVTITNYDRLSHTILADPQPTDNYTPGIWLLTHTYNIRKEIPVQYGNVLAGITRTTMTITDTLSSYVGLFIRQVSTNEMRRIVAFDTTTNVATVSPGFSAVPAGAYEILQFSYDNAGKLPSNFSTVSIQTAVCYKCTLLNLILPNTALRYHPGGHAIFYPYLYVALTAVNSAEGKGTNMIMSNNPNATRMLFRVIVNDSNDEVTSPVVRLDGSGMVQHMKFNPNDSFHFSVYLPDGSLFLTELAEEFSPLPPNPFIQISALFHFEKTN